ncbi:uncharacterized protein BDW43DRAFT_289960 [Aspergillus alliaceus]|uniref:uncharacterized protein n=1 Tax=Petromyces alliaceus TaxID=209559 RepID=UPI0012A6B480|nr:uncharacterized protein BDW43DRAFT_289960 [Aspergillus alliaceus]KAB8228778.1 hypothetical protein BDW43DRAFT_289960 [Aspergillus alliaceus]
MDFLRRVSVVATLAPTLVFPLFIAGLNMRSTGSRPSYAPKAVAYIACCVSAILEKTC